MNDHTTRTRRWRGAPALVISIVALFAALSGAAVALPGTETVNSGDIKNESVKSVDLKDGQAVTSDDVTDESLTGADLADGTVAGADIANDSVASEDLAPNSVRAQELGDGIHNHTNTVATRVRLTPKSLPPLTVTVSALWSRTTSESISSSPWASPFQCPEPLINSSPAPQLAVTSSKL